MTYGYIRVSSDKQTVENQRYEINIDERWFYNYSRMGQEKKDRVPARGT